MSEHILFDRRQQLKKGSDVKVTAYTLRQRSMIRFPEP